MIRGSFNRAPGVRNSGLAAALLGSSALAIVAGPAYAQNVRSSTVQGTSSASRDGQESQNSNEIIVTGIRASLQSALNEKRKADNLIEVIKAEDIGKLPDQNLAEVLENVTGVQITRSAGVGTAVQIRGTNANRTEINGVSTVGAGSGRSGISFEDLPASLISSVEVIKVPEAKTIEGSVGGTINLRTIRPLDLNKSLIAGRVQFEHSDLARSTLPRISGTIGDKWDTGIGEIGIAISGSYARQDVAEFSPRVDRDNLNLPGTGPSSQDFPFFQIQYFNQGTTRYQYKTYNGTASVEWKPAHNLKLYFDSTLNNQQRAQQSNRAQLSGVSNKGVIDSTDNTAFETVDLGTLQGPNGPIDLGTAKVVVAGTMGIGVDANGNIDSNLRTSSDTGSRITHSRVFDAGTEWQRGNLQVRAEASLSTSKTTNPNFSTTLDFINPHGPQPVFGTGSLDNGVPLEFDLRHGLTFGIDQASPDAPTRDELLDPANYRLNQVAQGANSANNKEKAARLDFRYDTSNLNSLVPSVEFGYRWNQTTAVNNIVSNNISFTNNSTGPKGRFNRPSGDLFSDILTAAPNNFNAADGRRLYFPDFLIIDGGEAFQDPSNVLSSLNDAITASNAANPQYPEVPLLAGPTESAVGYFSVKETTHAAYFQANLDMDIFGMPSRGNIGVRWLQTNLSSTGNNVANGEVTGTSTQRSHYTFLLPRFNMVLTPAHNVLVRTGISRDIRRPNFDDLSTSRSFGTSAEAVVQGGNPDLVPEVVWSFDLSSEYYFARSSLISLGFFHKIRTNLFSPIVDYPTPIGFVDGNPQYSIDPTCPGGGVYNPLANRNINSQVPGNGICAPLGSTFNVAGTTTQTGIEIAFQHDLSAYESTLGFASGFGFIGNFTYQKAGGSAHTYYTGLTTRNIDTGLGFPAGSIQSKVTLTDLSKFSYNTTLFYDKYGLNVRFRYTWRSSYVTNDQFRWNLPVIAHARGQLNASINYDITPNFNIGVEGINLLRGDQKLYCVNDNAVLCFQGLTDRRITAGVSVKF
ncbi:TonB-dependent receptor [Hephaestia mangrovi]|uniref:TonB-dependent receptor n=1 Tax=Hephaestia mangrovi TaxID=2873268 RepID=UPI001CA617ED|nr:TonB-dependent receptor [Hephaestia mangrovi]MBY8829432.1 TonB-dependent receptor [Hephaestia mangrovi]